MPLGDFILAVGNWNIISPAETPRWRGVWQTFKTIGLKHQPSGARRHFLPAAKSQRLLNPIWPTGCGNRLNLRLLDPPIKFLWISFSIRSFLLLEPQTSKMAARGPLNGRQGLESGNPQVFRSSRQLPLNKFFDPSTSCISTNQRPRNPKWPPGAPKWPTGSGKGSNPRLLGAPVNFL